MQLPRLRYDRIIWVLFLLVVGIILLAAIRGRKNSMASDTQVEIIPLDGGSLLISESDVRQVLLRAFGNTLKGTELERIDLDEIEKTLENNTFVHNADVYVDQRSVLRIRIEQRQPIVRVLDTNGGNYYLDKSGAKIQVSEHYAAHVLVATGKLPPYTADFLDKKKNKLKDLFTLTNVILEDEFLRHFIQQVHLNSRDEFVLVPLVGDQQIVLGSIKRLEDKIERLKIFYKKGMPYAGWRKYETINLMFNGQVVCQK
jgi:cell division protein FtsQ